MDTEIKRIFNSTFVASPTETNILTIGNADKTMCLHEYWEETDMLYTSCPPQRKQVCRLCGDVKFVSMMAPSRPLKWKKV